MTKKIRVGINGFGRIGRAFFRIASARPEVEIVAVNDLGDIEGMAYLLKYDTVYGKFVDDIAVASDKKSFTVNGQKVAFVQVKEPQLLPWKDIDVDVVV